MSNTPHHPISTASAALATTIQTLHSALGNVISGDFDEADQALVASYGGPVACESFVHELTAIMATMADVNRRMADAHEAGQRRAWGLA